MLTVCPRTGASALVERAFGSAYSVVACPAAHKQWIGEGVVIGRGAKTAAAEAFTDSLEHGSRDIQVNLNVSLAGRRSVAVEVSSRTAHPSSTPCESGRSSVWEGLTQVGTIQGHHITNTACHSAPSHDVI
jgi:hypothetical protein